MPPITIQSLGIDRLSVDERLGLIRDIWDSIAADAPASILSDSQRQELRKRVAEDDADPNGLIPLEEVITQVSARRRP